MSVEFGLQITEAASLLDSPGGAVLGVEKEQQSLSGIVFQPMPFAVATFCVEAGCFFIDQTHARSLRLLENFISMYSKYTGKVNIWKFIYIKQLFKYKFDFGQSCGM